VALGGDGGEVFEDFEGVSGMAGAEIEAQGVNDDELEVGVVGDGGVEGSEVTVTGEVKASPPAPASAVGGWGVAEDGDFGAVGARRRDNGTGGDNEGITRG
jgi:hypothetical protein